MSKDSRLDRLSEGLSARERAVLAVRAFQADEPEDTSIRGTMPDEQVDEFNDLLGMANGVLRILIPEALVLESKAQIVERELTLLAVLAAWGGDRRLLAGTALLALDAEGSALAPQLARARDELREQYESGKAPRSPDLLLPAFAEHVGYRAPPELKLKEADLAVVGLAIHIKRELPMLRSWLLTLEQVVDRVVEALDECAIPEPLRELLQTTHELIDAVPVADVYLGELPVAEVDELYADKLMEKVRNC